MVDSVVSDVHAGSSEEPLLRLEDTVIQYPGHGRRGTVLAVDGLSVDIHEGERFVVLGPSGCGKSTLLLAVAGFVPIRNGRALVKGQPVSQPGMDRIFVFQDFDQLLPWKTVLGNLEFALRRKRGWRSRKGRDELKKIAADYVSMVGMSAQGNQYPHTLSGGQKQRAAIARAFALQSDILLMDEPFSALDAVNRERMQDELIGLWEEQKTTILFVTHDVREAVRVGHRIMVMTQGPGKLKEIVEDVQDRDELEKARLVEELRLLLN